MFSTFVIGMRYNPQVLTVEAFMQGLQDWYSAPHLRPEPIFLLECWSIKSWMDPYIRGVQGTSRPHVLRFSCHEDDVQMFTKDYHSSASSWMGPYSFLNICPYDSPLPLLPAQLDSTILKDTLSALTELNNAQDICISLDLNNCMRPALRSCLLGVHKDWPDPEEDTIHLSPTPTDELQDPEPLRRGKRRR